MPKTNKSVSLSRLWATLLVIFAGSHAFQPTSVHAEELSDSVLREALGYGRSLFCVDIVSKRTEKEPLIGLT